MISSHYYDLAIIGGGINGAAIARDAALRGLSVFLCEKNEFGSGTSSKTSKLAHGGLRYLENFEFSLVKESLVERDLLIEHAPDFVQPLPFIFPIYKPREEYIKGSVPGVFQKFRVCVFRGGRIFNPCVTRVKSVKSGLLGRPPQYRPLWMVNIGLWIYDWFSRKGPLPSHQQLTPSEIKKMLPQLKQDALTGGCVYYDAQTRDRALVEALIASARQLGAVALDHTECNGFMIQDNRVTGITCDTPDGTLTVKAKAVIAVTGPWHNHLFKTASGSEQWDQPLRVQPSKGVHVILPEIVGLHHALILSHPQDGRIFFITPFHGQTLVGTTDTFYDGSPDDVSVEPTDREYLLTAFRHYFPTLSESHSRIVDEFVGLRPLLHSEESGASKASRDFSVAQNNVGVWSMLGGKYTTHRHMAQACLDQIIAKTPEIKPSRPCLTTQLGLPDYTQLAPTLSHALSGNRFITVAHRGCPIDGAYENTMAAFDKAFGIGATMIEFDVQLSADGIPFIFHDSDGSRFGESTGTLRHQPIDKIQRMKRFPIPTLDKLCRHIGSRLFYYLELKTFETDSVTDKQKLCEAVIQILQKHHLESRVMIVSFDKSILHQMHALAPHLIFGFNTETIPTPNTIPEFIKIICPDVTVLKETHVKKTLRSYKVLPYFAKPKDIQKLKKWGCIGATIDI